MDATTREEIKQAVIEAFSVGVDNKRFIDVSRIPLICQSINQIGIDIKEIKESIVTKEEFTPVKTLVYGMVGLALSAIVGALLMLVIKQP